MKYKPYDTLLDTCSYICGIIIILLFMAYKLASSYTDFALSDIMAPCFFHSITGYYCPGCGGTRALEYMACGQLLKSLYHHPVVLYTAVPGIYFMFTQTIYRLRGISVKFIHRNSPSKVSLHIMSVQPVYIYIGCAVLILQCIIKNALYYLFEIHIIS